MALKNGRQSSDLRTILVGSVIPSGTIAPFGGGTVPTGWLLCDGSAISRTTYGSLFLAIGTTYGIGDGASTFNLPDYRGRVPAGKDDMGGVAASRITSAGAGIDGTSLGAAGGAQTHTLSEAQLASHTHSIPTTEGQPGNGSGVSYDQIRRPGYVSAGLNTTTHAIVDRTSGTKGTGSAHQNTQPTIIANYIIKV